MLTAHLEQIPDTTPLEFRLTIRGNGFIVDVFEFSARVVCDGFFTTIFSGHKIALTCDWPVDFGRAQKLETKVMKALMQRP